MLAVILAALAALGGAVLALPRLAELLGRAEVSYACDCGCAPDTHEHYRPGSDCGACGRDTCPRYRPDHTSRLDAYPTGLSTGSAR